ncbi:MAG TPA: TPM domain-containing protein, partial [Gemmatimonadaceae bacterium]|nr:TPM domain-containing protein [Gemmatimonadaceae bacterium]
MQIWIAAALMALQAAEPAGVPAPPPARHYVVDEAGLLEGASVRLIDSIGVWRDRAGMPLYVLTMKSVAAHDSSDVTFEAYSRRVFDAWRKVRPHADRAAMLIVSEEDKQARIETGEGWGREHDPAIQLIMEDAIEPAMARGSLAQGIVAASYELTWALKPPVVANWERDAL